MKNRLLQKSLKKCAVFTAISLFVMLGSAYAHINKLRPAWSIPADKTAPNNLKATKQAKITGTVTDEKNLPLPGVNVRVKGTTIGASTDANGKYTIDAEQGATLVFSCA